MGMTRIVIETWQEESAAVQAGRAAVAAARAEGASVSAATATYHPGLEDERTVDLLIELA